MDEKRDNDRYYDAGSSDHAAASAKYPPEDFFNWLADATRSHELQDYLHGSRTETEEKKTGRHRNY